MSDLIIERLRAMATASRMTMESRSYLTDTDRELLELTGKRVTNLEAALAHAKLEFYTAGRRDLIVELLAELGYLEQPERIIEAAAAGEDFTEQPRLRLDQLARHYFTTVEETQKVPRLNRGVPDGNQH